MLIRSFFLFGLLASSAGAAAVPTDGYASYSGTADARHTSDFLYGEQHVLEYRQGRLAERVVLYTCHDGSAFARKVVNYVAGAPSVPDFLLEDASDGMREGIRSANPASPAGRTVFYRANAKAAEKSGPLPAASDLVADAGFDEFVRSHWASLMTGDVSQMRFLLPSRLEAYEFQVQRLRHEVVDGIPTEVFRLRLSGFWGWFLTGIDVYYSDSDHSLVRYDGLSDLRDASGDNFKVVIDFPPREAKPGDAELMQRALQTSLAPCRSGDSVQ
jgi:hypothetical protein